jgi:hypothetical protein
MSINLTELVATTLRNRQKEVADNVTNHNALLMRLEEKGGISDAAGGRTIVEELIYGDNGNVSWYDGYDTFTIVQNEVIDAAEFDWKQLGGFISISGKEQVMNSGKYAAINFVKARLKQLKAQMRNTAAASIYSDGTGSTGREFGGLRLLIADDPSAAGTVGGIDQAANAFWRNQIQGDTTTLIDSSNIKGALNTLWLKTIRGTDKPDLLLAPSRLYSAYEATLQDQQRFADGKMARAGFESLKYKSADFVYDENCTDDRVYFVNTDYLHMKCAPGRKFATGEARTIQNADHEVIPVWLMGNLTVSNRSLQGVLLSS